MNQPAAGRGVVLETNIGSGRSFVGEGGGGGGGNFSYKTSLTPSQWHSSITGTPSFAMFCIANTKHIMRKFKKLKTNELSRTPGSKEWYVAIYI